jgi:malonyl-CoA O-methyltransferase
MRPEAEPGRWSAVAGPSKDLIARSFGRAAANYDAVASLQREIGQQLLGSAPEAHALDIHRVLDVGAGTGFFSAALAERYPEARVIAVDLAEGMLRQAAKRFAGWRVVGDAEALPVASRSVDLVFSNVALQWASSAEAAFQEFHRVLRPGGRLLFTSFGPGTLRELREAWARVDSHTHVNEFIGPDLLRARLCEAGFVGISLHHEPRMLDYPDVFALMRELKSLGARNLNPGRPRHLLGRGALDTLRTTYPQTATGRAAASFEVIECRASCGWEVSK